MSFNPELAEILRAHADRPDISTESADLMLLAADMLERHRPVWLDPLVNHPPGGDVWLLTWEGIAIRGRYDPTIAKAWSLLHDTPAEIKRRKRA